MTLAFFATAAKGTEGALRDELRELRFRGVRATRGGVSFEGTFAEGMRACLELRCAMRVLGHFGEFDAGSEDALYEGVRALEWEIFLDARRTLAVRATTSNSKLTHSQYVAQKTKDAIVDRLRDRLGHRPSVDLKNPDVVISVHLARDRATVYVDLGGRPLFMRGYRIDKGDAPLKETLAASIVRLSGWDRKTPFIDPMCGSGTLAIEAAAWAGRLAPGVGQPAFGFTRWLTHQGDEKVELARLVEQARASARPKDIPEIIARDIDPRAIDAAHENARRAGVRVFFEQASVADLTAAAPVQIVTNPPYGVRVGFGAGDEQRMGRALAGLGGSRLAVLAGASSVQRAIPLKPEKTLTLMNGDIECRLALYAT